MRRSDRSAIASKSSFGAQVARGPLVPARPRAGLLGRLHPYRRSLLALAGLVALLAAMALGYVLTLRPFWVDIDGRRLLLRSHLATVGEALHEARIWLQPEDHIDPPPDTPLRPGLSVRVQRARTLHILADGEEVVHRSVAPSIGEALTEAGVKWIPEDRIIVGGQTVPGDSPLYALQAATRGTSSRGPRPTPLSEAPPDLQVTVQRAVPIGVQDGQINYTFLTTAATLGEALLEKKVLLYAADRIEPPLDTPVTAGMHAVIDRSHPVTLLVDGQIRQTRTRAQTVGELLAEEGLDVVEPDYTRPGANEPVVPEMRVTVVRVRESEVVEQESIPYQEEMRPNPELEIDQQRVENFGSPGVLKRSLKVRYENDIEVSRTVDREWVERPPMNRIISYGTKIVERQLETPEGTLTYWRKLRMRASSYTAATSGKTRDHPEYGITRVGWQARKGIIAVDPRVIPLFTKMYVPGYGEAVAADTGGLVLGMHIDLCYPEDALVHWWRWTDVYLLSPPPPASEITWILPDYPTER